MYPISKIVRDLYVPTENWTDRFMFGFMGLVCPNALEMIFEQRLHLYGKQWYAVIFGSIFAFVFVRFGVWARGAEQNGVAKAARRTASFLYGPPSKKQ